MTCQVREKTVLRFEFAMRASTYQGAGIVDASVSGAATVITGKNLFDVHPTFIPLMLFSP